MFSVVVFVFSHQEASQGTTKNANKPPRDAQEGNRAQNLGTSKKQQSKWKWLILVAVWGPTIINFEPGATSKPREFACEVRRLFRRGFGTFFRPKMTRFHRCPPGGRSGGRGVGGMNESISEGVLRLRMEKGSPNHAASSVGGACSSLWFREFWRNLQSTILPNSWWSHYARWPLLSTECVSVTHFPVVDPPPSGQATPPVTIIHETNDNVVANLPSLTSKDITDPFMFEAYSLFLSSSSSSPSATPDSTLTKHAM